MASSSILRTILTSLSTAFYLADICHRKYDVVGPFSRSLDDLHHLVSKTLDVIDNTTKFPARILYPLDFFPHSNPKHQAMVDEFISVLEKFLGTKRLEFSLAERWAQCPPVEAGGKPLKEYVAKVRSEFPPNFGLAHKLERLLVLMS